MNNKGYELEKFLLEKADINNIPINENKTQITKLSKGFTFLKKRFIITKTNKIICKIDKKVFIGLVCIPNKMRDASLDKMNMEIYGKNY